MENVKQDAPGEVDISTILRPIMAVRRLSVADLATAAGVSKSTMEKYLAGPSSPRLVTRIALSNELKLSLDRLVFGEIDPHEELLYGIAFQQFLAVISALKTDPEPARQFALLDAGSKEFFSFARNLAHERAVHTRATYREERRGEHFDNMKITAL